MSAQLELTEGAKARIRELQALSERAEEGDQDARRELRRAVKESAPEVIARCSDIARRYRWVVADTASGHNPLQQEAIVERAERLAAEIAGETPTPLEALLAERIASLWVLSEVQEALLFAWYGRGGDEHKRLAPSYLLQICRIQESVNRRYLQAIKTLGQVRKLQAGMPGVQVTTQINLHT